MELPKFCDRDNTVEIYQSPESINLKDDEVEFIEEAEDLDEGE
jgi:hypothetical protein